ncbi:hypothetical protein MMC25_000555 [Agyrium rufum]|nr:hypothetical protein [Agyrium rufum]
MSMASVGLTIPRLDGKDDKDVSDGQIELEEQLRRLRERLSTAESRVQQLERERKQSLHLDGKQSAPRAKDVNDAPRTLPPSYHHSLLLLADSALPLGSFAFSSGLESYLAHAKYFHELSPPPLHLIPTASISSMPTSRQPSHASSSLVGPSPKSPMVSHSWSSQHTSKASPKEHLLHFLHLSLSTHSHTTLPILIASYRNPDLESVIDLDDNLDASILCPVSRRASCAQGKALLSIWSRAFRYAAETIQFDNDDGREVHEAKMRRQQAIDALNQLPAILNPPNAKRSPQPPPSVSPFISSPIPLYSAHLPPLFALVAHALLLPLPETAYTFLLKHAQSVLSAGVRAGVMGPFEAQGLLAGWWLRAEIEQVLKRDWDCPVEEAGAWGGVMGDVWGGRHEGLYSRVFNN